MAKVLMFHRVLPDNKIIYPNAYAEFGTLISQTFLEKVLCLTKENGYRIVCLSELAEKENINDDDRVISLTFDDGYRDNYECALPVLEAFSAKATFYPVVEPCANNSCLPLDLYYHWVDSQPFNSSERANAITGKMKKDFYWMPPVEQRKFLDENITTSISKNAPDVGYMTGQQLRELSDMGHEIGSHGLTHSLFTAAYMTYESRMRELIESKTWLENAIGKPVKSFCFPAGRYNPDNLDEVKKAGYSSACLVKKIAEHSLPSFERIFVSPDSLDALRRELSA